MRRFIRKTGVGKYHRVGCTNMRKEKEGGLMRGGRPTGGRSPAQESMAANDGTGHNSWTERGY